MRCAGFVQAVQRQRRALAAFRARPQAGPPLPSHGAPEAGQALVTQDAAGEAGHDRRKGAHSLAARGFSSGRGHLAAEVIRSDPEPNTPTCSRTNMKWTTDTARSSLSQRPRQRRSVPDRLGLSARAVVGSLRPRGHGMAGIRTPPSGLTMLERGPIIRSAGSDDPTIAASGKDGLSSPRAKRCRAIG